MRLLFVNLLRPVLGRTNLRIMSTFPLCYRLCWMVCSVCRLRRRPEGIRVSVSGESSLYMMNGRTDTHEAQDCPQRVLPLSGSDRESRHLSNSNTSR